MKITLTFEDQPCGKVELSVTNDTDSDKRTDAVKAASVAVMAAMAALGAAPSVKTLQNVMTFFKEGNS